MARFAFALRMLAARFDPARHHCPYCESRYSIFLQRKWMITQARKCLYCGLIYRWPTDNGAANQQYYETEYLAEYATDLPDPEALQGMVECHFKGSRCDKSHRIDFLRSVTQSTGLMLDFGCAWGYTVYQYQHSGYQAIGFEIDRHRVRYGREKLGLALYSDADELKRIGKFDLILADHSLEHMANPGGGLQLFEHIISDNGSLVIFVPNGACLDARRRGVGVNGGAYIGEPHTVAFTTEWFARNLPRHGFLPRFYTPQGKRLPGDDYLVDQAEIALVATRIKESH